MNFNTLLLSVCVGLSAGIIVGSIRAAAKLRRRKNGTKERQPAPQPPASFAGSLMGFLKGATFCVLGISLVWTLYFMVLGLADSTVSEWAANCATLIVSVATIFSIFIAFYEFVRRKG